MESLLISTGAIRLWHLVANSLLSGVLFSFLMPASQAITAELVDQETLLNAVSLNAVGMGLMGIFGASLAGFVIEWVGAEAVYFTIATLYACALLALGRLPPGEVINGGTTSVWRDLR